MFNHGEKTWEQKGTKHVQKLGLKYKRKIIMVVSFNATGNILPPQIVFTNIIFKTFPPNNQGKRNCIKYGWDLTFIENHWSSLEIIK